jgi:hypothetical protein
MRYAARDLHHGLHREIPQPRAAMTETVVAIFVIVYVGMIAGGLPFLQLDRTGVALLGAIAVFISMPARARREDLEMQAAEYSNERTPASSDAGA